MSTTQSAIDEVMSAAGIPIGGDRYWSLWNLVYCAVTSWIPHGLDTECPEAAIYVSLHWQVGHAGRNRYDSLCVGESK